MCFNFTDVQKFAQVEAGIYPLLVRSFGAVPQILYFLQLAAAGAADYLLIRRICPVGRFWNVWYVLALLTLPMAMQCHLALLPYSFVSSLFLLELCFCGEAMVEVKGLRVVELTKAGVCFLALAMLLPEYRWLGIIPLLLTVLVRLLSFRKNVRQLAYCVVIVVAFAGMIAGLGSLTESGEKTTTSFWFSMAGRMAWPTLWDDADKWSDDLRSITKEVLWDAIDSPGNMERMLQPAVESAVGTGQAQGYYREMTVLAWRLHRPQIAKQLVWDVLTYAVPQAVLQAQLTGRGYDSYSGRNYEIMFMRHPLLTKYYVGYSCWWFGVSLAVTVFLAGARLTLEKDFFRKGISAFLAVMLFSMGSVVFFYTMRGAGIADYKCTVAVAVFWMILSFYCMAGKPVFRKDKGNAAERLED